METIVRNTETTISNICQRCHRTISRLDSGVISILYYQELQDFWANPKHNRFEKLNPGDFAILAHGQLDQVFQEIFNWSKNRKAQYPIWSMLKNENVINVMFFHTF